MSTEGSIKKEETYNDNLNHIKLGSYWTSLDIRRFFSLYKKYGNQWDVISKHLPDRSIEMLKAFYSLHNKILNSEEGNSDKLCTLMEEYYEKLEKHEDKDGAVTGKRKRPSTSTPPISIADTDAKRTNTLSHPNESSKQVQSKLPFTRKTSRKSVVFQHDLYLSSEVSPEIFRSRLLYMMNCLSSKLRNWCRYEWCYSDIDHEYFLHNEFLECLKGLGIGHLSHLTRTEWCAARAAMGRPRRLSVAFLNEERAKLHQYRDTVRQIQWKNISTAAGLHFPYQVYAPIPVGTKVTCLHPVLLQLHTGVVHTFYCSRFSYRVKFDLSDLGVKQCPDIYIMSHENQEIIRRRKFEVLGNIGVKFRSRFREEEVQLEQQQQKLLDVSSSTKTMNLENNSFDLPALIQRRTSELPKYRLISYIRKLLERKELLLYELEKMNDDAECMQNQTINKNTNCHMVYPQVFQKQYAWIIVNLDLTNKALTPAMNDLRAELTYEQGDFDKMSSLDSAQHMWIDQQLNQSLNQSRQLLLEVLKNEDHEVKKEEETIVTKQLIAFCSSLLNVLKFCSEYDLSENVLHSLLQRALDLLQPRCATNISLFQEIESSMKVLESICILAHREN